ncbi:peptide chain release factor family protein [Verrucomicrobiota bacterium]
MTNQYVTKSKRCRLAVRMKRLGVVDDDLVERFIRGSGKGGQKLNKTSSCVYLKHVPTGIQIKCQRERSRELNRFLARKELCEQIEERVFHEASARRQKEEKIRRQKRRRSRRQRQKILEEKRKNSEKKKLRRPVQKDD